MFEIEGIWTSDKKMKIATGLSVEEINFIFKDFKGELGKMHSSQDEGAKKGRPSKLSTEELFLMLMIFIRHYVTFELLSLIFNIDVSNVKRWIDSSHKALGEVLSKKNLCHLISLNQKKLSESDLKSSEKFILMELNNRYVDQKTM